MGSSTTTANVSTFTEEALYQSSSERRPLSLPQDKVQSFSRGGVGQPLPSDRRSDRGIVVIGSTKIHKADGHIPKESNPRTVGPTNMHSISIQISNKSGRGHFAFHHQWESIIRVKSEQPQINPSSKGKRKCESFLQKAIPPGITTSQILMVSCLPRTSRPSTLMSELSPSSLGAPLHHHL